MRLAGDCARAVVAHLQVKLWRERIEHAAIHRPQEVHNEPL